MKQTKLLYTLTVLALLLFVTSITACENEVTPPPENPEAEDSTVAVTNDEVILPQKSETEADEEIIEGIEQTVTLKISSPTGDTDLPGHFDRADRYFDPTDWNINLPKLSFDNKYLLGPYGDNLLLYSHPDRELLKIINFGKTVSVRDFYWHPKNDLFICFVEHNKETWIFLVRVNGESTLLLKLSEDKYPIWWVDWGHQGESFAFVYEGREESTMYLFDLTGEIILETTIADCYGIRSPLSSPGGDKIFFVPTKTQTEDLWYWDLGNGQIEQVTQNNTGDYPFAWLNHNSLLVRVGAIGTGGGNLYGVAVIDVSSGNRSSSYYMVADSVDGPRKLSKSEPADSWHAIYNLKSVSPNGKKVIGDDMDGSGYNPAISILDLDSGNIQYLVKGAILAQAVWVTDASNYIVAERVNGIENRYTIYNYSMQSGINSLIESEHKLFIVGVVQGQLHYLRQKEDLWYWETLAITN